MTMLLYGNGRVLEVRRVGRVGLRLLAGALPIKFNGYRIVDDEEEVRRIVDSIISQGATRDEMEG